jgi:hypothetical protein
VTDIGGADIDTHLIYPRNARGFGWTASTPGFPLSFGGGSTSDKA